MKILKRKKRRKSAKKVTHKRRRSRVTTPRVQKRRRKTTKRSVVVMKKSRRRKGVKRHHKARRHYSRVKRNPSFSGSGIVNSLIGVGSAGLGGVAVIKLSAAIAKLAGITSEGQKNLIRIALTLGAGYMLPKYMKSQYVKSFVDGMGAVTAVKFAETATGINLLSGDDDIDALVRNIDVQGVTEIGYDYPSSLMGAELFDESSLLGVTELNGGDDMDQF